MKLETAQKLVDINGQFYQTFARSFAETRRRIQPGVRRVLDGLPARGRWLDIGCGSGALAAAWVQSGREGAYLGMDFSAGLLDEARSATTGLENPQRSIRFAQADLSAPDWAAPLSGQTFDAVLAFAVLHHLPGVDLRRRLARDVFALLPPGGLFIHSHWQFQHSEKLMRRVLPWQTVGLDDSALDPGDTLLDWRHPLPGQPDARGLRYVHLFSLEELEELARETGFGVRETFESDGEGGRLGLYQVWQKA